MTLTKHEVGWVRNGPVYGTGLVYQYRVGGLPPNEKAFIANFGSCHHARWKTLRVRDGVSGGWRGDYASADDALTSMRVEAV